MVLKIEDNLFLELIKMSDAQEVFDAVDTQRDYLGEWLPFVFFIQDVSDEETFIKSILETMEQTKEYVFCIRKNGYFVGLISFVRADKLNKKIELGYWISKKYQKQGIVIKSVERLCEFAFNDMGMNRVQIRCAVENQYSKNIPKRLGVTFEGIERQGEYVRGGLFRDLEVYSKLRNE